uniref:Uncharacterized protein n=1 Tax=Haemonchus contortus TaxID=6289 RepID=A0A7I4YKR7_HAECO|nr:unnamed protein product [Haemonchus contortus]
MDAPDDVQHQEHQDYVPVEPGENNEGNNAQPQLEQAPPRFVLQPEFGPLNESRIQRDESENIESMHRKINTILGITDEI